MGDMKIAVIGGGVVGLNTVIALKEAFPACQLTLLAERFGENTTSHGPPGIFRPSGHFCAHPQLSAKWVENSYRFYESLMITEGAGVSNVSGYCFSNTHASNVRNAYLENLLPVYRVATENERERSDGNGYWKYGSYCETLLTRCNKFLPWALEKFSSGGGVAKETKIDDFDQLNGQFQAVFNCSGLNSKYLCGDEKVVPIRGQLLEVRANPPLKHFYYEDADTYVIPVEDGNVVLGGCRNYGSYDVRINRHDTASIMERCSNLVPNLRMMREDGGMRAWVGLRPHRGEIRVEVEKRFGMKIIHNYGHGGCGITLAPGTARFAVELFVKSHASNSKL